MAVSGKVYYPYLKHAIDGEVIPATHNIRVSLHSSTYTPSQAHAHASELTNELGTTLGYTAEGQTITVTSSYSSATTRLLASTDSNWTTATISARYAVVYCRNGANSASWPLIGYVDFGETMSSSAGTFTIAWSTNGIVTITTD